MTLTPEEMTSEERITAGKTIDVDKRGNKTMTRHRMGYQGVLRFNNKSSQPLVVAASTGTPFELPDCNDPVGQFTVPGGGQVSVKIHATYTADEFTYSAQIDGTEAEDPIVIIDRH